MRVEGQTPAIQQEQKTYGWMKEKNGKAIGFKEHNRHYTAFQEELQKAEEARKAAEAAKAEEEAAVPGTQPPVAEAPDGEAQPEVVIDIIA